MLKKSHIHLNKSIVRTVLFSLFLMVAQLEILHGQETNFKEYIGEIVDDNTKKPLVFATLTIEGTNVSTISNTEGQFSLKVPQSSEGENVIVSFLGYKTISLPISQFSSGNNEILMTELITELSVVNIYKTPYSSQRIDAVELFKARKSTDYSKLDTVALKLQGGPFNALFVDMVKYPDYIFTKESIGYYDFSFVNSTRVDDKLIYVVNFKQKPGIIDPLFKGKLYIDAENKILTSAIYSLNITDKKLASKMFVRKKPNNANVWPTEVAYRVDYREKNGKWYYGYSNVLLEFKIDWDKKLFNSVYSMSCEMAVTDWEKNIDNFKPKSKERMKSNIILSDEAIGFADPDFWGEYNIIEPEKSIESAIRKIQRQLRRSKNDQSGTSVP